MTYLTFQLMPVLCVILSCIFFAVGAIANFVKRTKLFRFANNITLYCVKRCRIQAAMSTGKKNKAVQAIPTREVRSVRDEGWTNRPTFCLRWQSALVFIFSYHYYRAMHFSAKRGIAVVCRPSARLSVTFRHRDHIGWNSSKIISRPNSLGPMWGLTPTWAIWCNGNTPKIGAV